MHRQLLLNQLSQHKPFDGHEASCLKKILAFVREHEDCLQPCLQLGHITGSCWLLNLTEQKILLTYHKKLKKWIQLGGHADGNPDILQVALREAREESGIQDIIPVSQKIFYVDVHVIPAHQHEPQHLHYDISFLLKVQKTETLKMSDESLDLKWFSAEEFKNYNWEESVKRMWRKWQEIYVYKLKSLYQLTGTPIT